VTTDTKSRILDAALALFNDRGTAKVTTNHVAAALNMSPGKRLPSFLAKFPDIEVEVDVDDKFVDMVAGGFDAGIRYGGTVPEGMIASRLTPDLEWVVAGGPADFAESGRPQRPEDLMHHKCIRIRTGTDRIYHWEFRKAGQALRLDVPGSIMVGDSELSVRLAEKGVGLFYTMRARVEAQLQAGTLELCLEDWAFSAPGFCAYYSSHRQVPTALRALLDHLKSATHAS
jgi:DNA-binding transcriptional LysR family regulator